MFANMGMAPPKGVNVRVFTASGTWTKPAGLKAALIWCMGGGGGGGSGQVAVGGGGGGGGATMGLKYMEAKDMSPSCTVTVGSKGLKKTGSNQTGGNGGTSSFGVHISAYGGQGGAGGGGTRAGGSRGYCTGHDVEFVGSQGGVGEVVGTNGYGGAGGGSFIGAPAFNVDYPQAWCFGSGGGGGHTFDDDSGDGGAGLVIIWEYF